MNAINASGRVVGRFIDSNGTALAFLYNGSVATVIGYVNGDSAMAINDRGVMISGGGINFDYGSFRITCHGIGC